MRTPAGRSLDRLLIRLTRASAAHVPCTKGLHPCGEEVRPARKENIITRKRPGGRGCCHGKILIEVPHEAEVWRAPASSRSSSRPAPFLDAYGLGVHGRRA